MTNKRLGQHFLQNGAKLQKIADALEIQKGDVIIEIGPGRGELTEKLLAAGARVIAIEKEVLLWSRPGLDHLEMVYGDVREKLSVVVKSLEKKPYFLAGNIPYYLTGYLLRMIGDIEHKPVRTVFTIQKEVAERICKTEEVGMNILAASILWWADAAYITTIPRKMFNPPPKIDSAVILLKTKPAFIKGGTRQLRDHADYMKFVKVLFAHPRKTALSNLLALYKKKAVLVTFTALDISANIRPERLSFEKILELYKTLPSLKDDRP